MPNDGGERVEGMFSKDSVLDPLGLENGTGAGGNPEADLNKDQRRRIEQVLSDFRFGSISNLPKNVPKVIVALGGVESYGPDTQFLVKGMPLARNKRTTLVDMPVTRQEIKLPNGISSFEELFNYRVRFGPENKPIIGIPLRVSPVKLEPGQVAVKCRINRREVTLTPYIDELEIVNS